MKKFFIFISFLCLLIFYFIRNKAVEPKPQKEQEKIIFTHAINQSIHSADPLDSLDVYTRILALAVYDRLYEYRYLARPYDLKPSLAKEFPHVSEDRLTYTIPLREGVFFTDDACFLGSKGRELIAEDFVYSIKRHFDPKVISASAWILKDRIVGLSDWKGFDNDSEIPGLKALDKKTIQIKLKEPYPQFLHNLAMAFSCIVPKEAVDFYGKDFARKSVGSGPWKFKSFTDKRVVLVKNPNFREEIFRFDEHLNQRSLLEDETLEEFRALDGKALPFCDEIDIDCISRPTTAWLSFLKGGELDFLNPPHSFASRVFDGLESRELKDDLKPKYSHFSEISSQVPFFGFNMGNPSFGYHKDPIRNKRNRALRKAIRYAFNWKDYIWKRSSNQGTLFPGIVPPFLAESLNSLPKDSIVHSPKKAKEILKEFSWNAENLPEITYTSLSDMASRQNFELFQSYLMAIGYPKEKIVNHIYPSFNDLIKDIKESKLPSFGFIVWYMDIPDPFDLLQLFYSKNKAPGMNFFNYENLKYDQILKDISKLPLTSQKREELVREAAEIIIEDCPLISGFSPYKTYLWNKKYLIRPSLYFTYFKYIALKE